MLLVLVTMAVCYLFWQFNAPMPRYGYAYILLDTLPFLQSAIQMYKSFGFYEIESYNDSPMDTSIYMKRPL